MTFFGKMKAYYVNLAYLKLESGPNMRVTILDRSRRQRVKNLVPLFDLKYVIRYPIYGCLR